MAIEIKLDERLWEEFVQAARKRKRNPISLLTDYIREYLEIQEDRQLDEEIQAEAQSSGYREEDAVEIVRQYRQEKKEQRAASQGAHRNLILATAAAGKVRFLGANDHDLRDIPVRQRRRFKFEIVRLDISCAPGRAARR